MEYLKEQLKDSPVISGLEASTLLNGCNLSNLKHKDNIDSMFMEDLMAAVVAKSRKRKAAEQ
ncbi:hypothetical protein BVC80_8897g21 [Macleaya cordata]|uniref:Uncharacterized protein n=1 Tax=Macleaya cordata TaxID=56857 RepID=A0A200Q3V5_MACCD|nr:hypothetical protein BVC80_8897g21 [Macleaya cordata]